MKTAIIALGNYHPQSPRALDSCQNNNMQASASKGYTTEFTSSLPSNINYLGFYGDWHRPYFVVVIWAFVFCFFFFCMTIFDLDGIQRNANPVKEKMILEKPVSTIFR